MDAHGGWGACRGRLAFWVFVPVARLFAPGRVIAIALFKKGDVCRGQQPAHRCLSAPDARLGFAYLRLPADFSVHPNAQYPAASAPVDLPLCCRLHRPLCPPSCCPPSPPLIHRAGVVLGVLSVPRGGRGVCATAGKRRWVWAIAEAALRPFSFACQMEVGGEMTAPGGS